MPGQRPTVIFQKRTYPGGFFQQQLRQNLGLLAFKDSITAADLHNAVLPVQFNTTNITGGTTVAAQSGNTYYLVDPTAGDCTVTLPAASGSGSVYGVKRLYTGTYRVVINAAGNDQIENSVSYQLTTAGASVLLMDAQGPNKNIPGRWVIVAAYDPQQGFSVTSEVPAGSINGINRNFTLTHTPIAGSVALYRNGIRQSAPGDYSIAGATITFAAAPLAGDSLLADYRYGA